MTQRWDTWDLVLVGTMLTLLLACILYALYEWRQDVRSSRIAADKRTDAMISRGMKHGVKTGIITREDLQ